MYAFRQATMDDYKFLYELNKAAMRPYVEEIWGWHEDWQQEYFEKKFDPANRQIILLGDQEIGVLVLENRDEYVFIALIEVLPRFQGRGIGTTIIRTVIEDAHAQNLPVLLSVLKSNRPARRLYERLGFSIKTTEKYRYLMIFPVPSKEV